jgi:hypothetical protein
MYIKYLSILNSYFSIIHTQIMGKSTQFAIWVCNIWSCVAYNIHEAPNYLRIF